MTKFSEMKYERPDLDGVKAQLSSLTRRLKEAGSYDEARAVFLAVSYTHLDVYKRQSRCWMRTATKSS